MGQPGTSALKATTALLALRPPGPAPTERGQLLRARLRALRAPAESLAVLHLRFPATTTSTAPNLKRLHTLMAAFALRGPTSRLISGVSLLHLAVARAQPGNSASLAEWQETAPQGTSAAVALNPQNQQALLGVGPTLAQSVSTVHQGLRNHFGARVASTPTT